MSAPMHGHDPILALPGPRGWIGAHIVGTDGRPERTGAMLHALGAKGARDYVAAQGGNRPSVTGNDNSAARWLYIVYADGLAADVPYLAIGRADMPGMWRYVADVPFDMYIEWSRLLGRDAA